MYAFLELQGWQEVGSKNSCGSVGLANKPVDDTLF